MSERIRVVLSTAPAEQAEGLARALVEARVVACVNVLPGARSVYRWQGEVQCEAESVLVMKTTAERYPDLEAALSKLHPYDVPELLALPVEAGLETYLGWVATEVAP